MSFYINSNLSPTEAVRMHEELQVHPIIEEWAEIAEMRAEIKDDESTHYVTASVSNDFIEEVINDKTLNSAKKVKEALKALL